MYIIKANATDRNGNAVNVYIANTNNPQPLTTSQRDAARFDNRADCQTAHGFRVVKLVPRVR